MTLRIALLSLKCCLRIITPITDLCNFIIEHPPVYDEIYQILWDFIYIGKYTGFTEALSYLYGCESSEFVQCLSRLTQVARQDKHQSIPDHHFAISKVLRPMIKMFVKVKDEKPVYPEKLVKRLTTIEEIIKKLQGIYKGLLGGSLNSLRESDIGQIDHCSGSTWILWKKLSSKFIAFMAEVTLMEPFLLIYSAKHEWFVEHSHKDKTRDNIWITEELNFIRRGWKEIVSLEKKLHIERIISGMCWDPICCLSFIIYPLLTPKLIEKEISPLERFNAGINILSRYSQPYYDIWERNRVFFDEQGFENWKPSDLRSHSFFDPIILINENYEIQTVHISSVEDTLNLVQTHSVTYVSIFYCLILFCFVFFFFFFF
ncbi:MAG: hypothetical protein GY714_32435, partial [Desulfobacterales bacterium]|nr:hypothetical protein [Desulfobacterales bacterium]